MRDDQAHCRVRQIARPLNPHHDPTVKSARVVIMTTRPAAIDPVRILPRDWEIVRCLFGPHRVKPHAGEGQIRALRLLPTLACDERAVSLA